MSAAALREFHRAAACVLTLLLWACGTGSALAQSASFVYTGAVQTYTVPLGVGSITMQIAGGGGGGGGADENGAGAAGGSGAMVTGTVLVTGGSVLYIYVGGGGKQGYASNFGHSCTTSAGAGGVASGTAGLAGGTGGQAGCSGWSGGGGGGGAATVVTNSSGTVLMVAGGGGGGEGGSLSSTSAPSVSSTALGALPGSAGATGTSRGSSADGGGGGGGGAGCPGGAGGSGHADSSGTSYGTAAGAGASCANATYVSSFKISTTPGGSGGTGDSASNGSTDPANATAGGNGSALVTGIAGPNHYAVSAASSAVNCAPTTVTVTAHTSTHAVIATVNTITLGTSTGHGDWTLVTGAGTFTAGSSNSGAAAYTYVSADAGVAVFALRDTYPETVTINVSDGTATAASGTALASEDSPITFAPSGFITTNGANVATLIGTQIAGKPSTQSLALQAVRTDTNTGACTSVFSSGATANVSLAYQCNNPTACIAGQTLTVTNNSVTTAIASNPNTGVTAYTTVPLKFSTANAEAPIVLTYSDAGQITLLARYNIPLGNGTGSGNLMNGSSQFVVQPYTLVLSNVRCSSYGAGTCSTALASPGNNPAAASAAGAAFLPAGQPFSATVTAQNYLGAATPNFGRETTPAAVTLASTLVAPSGGDAAALNNASAFGTFSAGSATGTTFSWAEVGIIGLTPGVSNYLGSGAVAGTASGNVGRFYPNAFAVARNIPVFGTACAAGAFSYIGQPLTFTVAPVATVTALALGGATTRNYTGAFMKISNATLTGRTYTPTPASPSLNLSGLPATSADPAIVDLGTGQATLTFSAGTGLVFNRGAAIPPFNANIALGFNVLDADGVSVASIDGVAAANPVTFGTGSGISFSTSAAQYYGRLALRDSVGSELLDLPLPLTTQYYLNGTVGFTTNTADSCTAAPALTLSGYQGNLTAGKTCVRDTGSPGLSGVGCSAPAAASSQYRPTAVNGNLNLILAAPGAGNNGALSVTAAAPSWLQYVWAAGPNPIGIATFGEFPAPASRVHQREVY
jgi:MSHA biogenesis protein MshQ